MLNFENSWTYNTYAEFEDVTGENGHVVVLESHIDVQTMNIS